MLQVLANLYILLVFQVLAKVQEDEGLGWWVAKIKMFRGEFAVVEFSGWGDKTHSDIVPLEKLRPVNTQ